MSADPDEGAVVHRVAHQPRPAEIGVAADVDAAEQAMAEAIAGLSVMQALHRLG